MRLPIAALRHSARGRAALLAVAALAGTALLLPSPTAATCWCVFLPPLPLWWTGQLNLVVRDGGTVRLIPNIRVEGAAEDFALIVPTPSLPTLAPVEKDLWTEAADLTKPLRRRPINVADCGTRADFDVGPSSLDAVTIHSQETIGAFEATIVSSTDPTALVTWLTDNGYLPDASQVAAFTPLVTDGWFFTAMKLVPGTPVPANGWDTSVDPVEFTFAADEFVIPLDVLAINAAPAITIGVYSVDDHRMTLPGFATTYSNRLDDREMGVIASRYPTLAPYLESGRTLTLMSRWFPADQLAGRITLERAPTDDEFRSVFNARTVPGDVLMMVGLVLGLAWRSARARRRRPAIAAG